MIVSYGRSVQLRPPPDLLAQLVAARESAAAAQAAIGTTKDQIEDLGPVIDGATEAAEPVVSRIPGGWYAVGAAALWALGFKKSAGGLVAWWLLSR